MYRRFFKRFIDVLLSFILIILLSPLYIILMLYVIFTMGWPPFFGQERIGRDNKPFRLLKFRSMSNKVDSQGNLLPENERLSKFGIMIRNSSLDELPELWSILTGKMSFVGPRPMPTYYGPYFFPNELKRHNVRGGLIPPDSLSGKSLTSYEEQFRYECDYVDNVTFYNDMKIILATFKILFLRVAEDYGTCDRPHLNVYRHNMTNRDI